MKAVILAAGTGSRLKSITSMKPKCMIRIGGRSILARQIQAYVDAGVKDIIVMAGYRSDEVKDYCKRIKRANVKVVENKEYKTTNNMYSLYLAKKEEAGKEFLMSNGDVVLDPDIIYRLVHSDTPNAIVCDRGSYNNESMKIKVDAFGYATDISKEIPPSLAYGNSIDVYKFSSRSSALLFEEIRKIIEDEANVRDWVEVALQRLLKERVLKMVPFNTENRHWVEIDDIEDLLLADRLFSKIRSLGSKRLFFIDLDGTIYLGDTLIRGAAKFLAKLRAMHKYIFFLSNNSSKSKQDYVIKLNSMGIEASKDEIVLSTDGVIQFLLKEGIRDIFIAGTNSMRQAFEEAGFNIEAKNPNYIVLGYDTELTYSKICRVALLLQKGANLIATHPDVVCPTSEGMIPDIGSMLALFKVATGKIPIKIFGKPNPEMVSHVMKQCNVAAEDVVIIADRLYTDMELSKRIGCNFVCVLSGETRREDIETNKSQPDLIVRDVSELIDFPDKQYGT